MKKLFLVIISIFIVTGCSGEMAEQPSQNNSNNEQPKQITCEDGFYNRDNECVSTEGVYNLNDNISFQIMRKALLTYDDTCSSILKQPFSATETDRKMRKYLANGDQNRPYNIMQCSVDETNQPAIDYLKSLSNISNVQMVDLTGIATGYNGKSGQLAINVRPTITKKAVSYDEISMLIDGKIKLADDLELTQFNLFEPEFDFIDFKGYSISISNRNVNLSGEYVGGFEEIWMKPLTEDICKDFNLTCGRW